MRLAEQPAGGTNHGTETALILPLHRAGRGDLPLVGGKAANLGVLLRAKLPVPSGFCITVTAFRRFLDACPKRADLLRILTSSNSAPPEQAARLSHEALACLAQVPVSAEVGHAILAAWRAQGTERAYAVRSSATVEDATDHSFAGQFESFLNVRGPDALIEAVRKCWLSLFSARSLAYHARNELPLIKSGMAVVVQEMIPAHTAGVLFTLDPITGDPDRIVIEAAPGLGENVVGGHAAPERIILARPSFSVVARFAGGQPAGDGPVVDDRAAYQLALLSQRVEAVIDGALDLEWAAHNGSIHLLQARPATGRAAARTREDRQIWTNANAAEALPEPLTPMTHSMMMRLLQGLVDNLMAHIGFRVRPEELITLFAGRPYFSMNIAAALLRYAPGLRPEDVGDIFGGAHEPMVRRGLLWLRPEDVPRLRFHPWEVLRGMPPVLLQGARFLLSRNPLPIPSLPSGSCAMDLAPVQCLPDGALLERLPASLPTEHAGRHPAVRFMGLGAFFLVVFFALCKRWFGAQGPEVAGRLVSGLGRLNPAEAGRELWHLAVYAREHPLVCRAVLEDSTFAVLESRLLVLEEGRGFLDRWRGFLARHGHHARGEVELMNPRWGETPDLVLDMVRHYLQSNLQGVSPSATRTVELAEERTAFERECLRRLRGPLRRWLFRRVLEAARRGVTAKENVKSGLVQWVCQGRLLLLELGRRLVQRGRLAEPDDIFFLRIEELRPELLFDPESDLRELVAPRRAEYARNLRLHPPAVVLGRGDPRAWETEADVAPAERIEGLAVSPGVATGRARVILRPDAADRVLSGEILVAPSTDPAWSLYFLTAAGVAIDLGGVLSHGSILAREYGLPAVTNLGAATRIIRTGDLVQVDGNRGEVTVLERAASGPSADPTPSHGPHPSAVTA